MLILGTQEEFATITRNCFGNCKESNCIFKDLKECPIDNDKIEIKKNSCIAVI